MGGTQGFREREAGAVGGVYKGKTMGRGGAARESANVAFAPPPVCPLGATGSDYFPETVAESDGFGDVASAAWEPSNSEVRCGEPAAHCDDPHR